MPSICGMLMSISTRAGLSSSASWTASVPVDASPASSKHSRRRSTALAASRNGAWSSTTRTECGLLTVPASHGCPGAAAGAATLGPVWSAPLVLAEVDQHRLDPAVEILFLGQPELGEDRVGVLLDRPFRDGQRD